MSGVELRVWEGNIPHVYAEELLRERGGSLSPQELYAALVLAFGDARKAAVAAARRELRRG
jgi:hypothetical protein